MKRLQITLIGDATEIQINNQIASEIGAMIAKNDWILLTGGRSGVMQSAAKSALENNGVTVGILPDQDLNSGNPYNQIVIATGIGYARNSITASSADIVIVVGGGAGTLCEAAFAWNYDKIMYASRKAIGWSQKLADTSIDKRRNDFIIGFDTVLELEDGIKKNQTLFHT